MKKLIVLLLLSNMASTLTAQVNLDSLFTVWYDLSQPDTSRLRAMWQIAYYGYYATDPDSSYYFAQLQYDLAESIDNTKWMSDALNTQGVSFAVKGDYDQALTYLFRAKEMAEQNGHKLELSRPINNIGVIYSRKGDNASALDYYLEFLTLEKELGNQDSSLALLNIANIYIKKGDYTQAFRYLKRGGESAKRQGIKEQMIQANNGIANLYMAQGEVNKATELYSQNLEIGEAIGNKLKITEALSSLGALYISQGDSIKALDHFERALIIMKEMGRKQAAANFSANLAGIYEKQGNKSKALEHYNHALHILEETGNKGAYYIALKNFVTRYTAQDEHNKRSVLTQEDFNEMLPLALDRLKLYQEGGDIANIKITALWLFEGYKRFDQYQQALEMHELYIQIRDSLNTQANQKAVIRQQIQSEYEIQKAQENLARELAFQTEFNQQKTTRNIVLSLGLIALLAAIGLFYRLRFIRKTQKLLRTKNQLIEAEKEKAQASERAKQQFLANMSHEIRTPMNAIKGMTDILLRRKPSTDQLNYLSAIKESSNSLLVIINDILDLSKIDAGKIDFEEIPFSLTGVIDNVMNIMQFKAEEKGLQLKTDFDQYEDQQVIGDPTRLHQILLNLVGNAIKFTEKGVVTIQLKRDANDPKGLRAQFCVSDTGVGIGEDRLEKIFESFEQAYSDTSRKFGGSGLGLTISKKLVELQDGRIWAESQKGKGSQFYVSLPFALAAAEVEEEVLENTVQENIASQLKGIKVLLVEDNKFNAIVAQEELEDSIEDAEVTVAENGVIAVEQLKSGDFDVVLMDVQMPVMNGYEATLAIRKLENGETSMPIIAMTANVMKEEVERCFGVGMDDFIGKPFETAELLGKMHKLVRKKNQS